MKKTNKLLCILLMLCATVKVFSATEQDVVPPPTHVEYDPSNFIKININSGNPAFPFPQFLEYGVGDSKSMALYNAEGVTHADMELTMREAYEIMTHRCRYEKDVCGGVKYITFNGANIVHGTYSPHCSEGDGYMLLMAAVYADQPTFNGLWMWVHDYKIPHAVRYIDGKVLFEDYPWSPGLPLCFTTDRHMWTSENGPHGLWPDEASATDGDDDIALALLIAYKQWGEPMMNEGKPVLDFNGKPISYKEMLDDFLKAYADTFMVKYSDPGDPTIKYAGHSSGDIGIDGYVTGGNKSGDITQWRATQTDYSGITSSNIKCSSPFDHVDYVAPAYYNEFAKYLEEEGEGTGRTRPWLINQYKRAEASSDWLVGQAYAQGKMAFYGGPTQIALDGSSVQFTPFSDGEDFRFAMRTILNYLWHGNPTTSWNPKTHQVDEKGNTYEYDMAIRHAQFMKRPRSGYGAKKDAEGRCAQMGMSPDKGQPYWEGPVLTMIGYDADGNPVGNGSDPTPYTLGISATAAVSSGDIELVWDMYRQSEVTWDGTERGITWDSEERYIGSTPHYFHGFCRNWGLLIHSGNLHAPSKMKPAANMKVYMSVDKTYCYQYDEVKYGVQYRNYGSLDATGVTIETEIDPNYDVVEISDGGKFDGTKITWNIGTVPGFKTNHLEETKGEVTFKVVARDTLNPRICLTSTITGDNFEPWISNEYPNNATYTMERNCVDVVPTRTLQLKKTASRKMLNPNDAVTFTLEFENKSLGEVSWLNGGRNHVRMSYANYLSGTELFQGYRFWNDAYEAYINMGNYRVSYFMYDAAAIGLYDPVKNKTGWDFSLNNAEDIAKYGMTDTPDTISFHYQRIPSGMDSVRGTRWNQRLMVQFAKYEMGPSSYIFNKISTRVPNGAVQESDNFNSLHKGVFGPAFARTQLRTHPPLQMSTKVVDDWSYEKLEVKEGNPGDMQSSPLYLITPCYADVNNLGYEVDKHARSVCDLNGIDPTTYDRILVEEFDGYTWRRILGRAPLPGRECMNVQIVDTIPYELEFHHWVDSTALKTDKGEKIQATYTPAPTGEMSYSGIIRWSVPSMLVGEKDKLVYVCKARDIGCPDAEDAYYKNVAWISSETDSPDSSQVELMTTCAEIPVVIDEQKSLFKDADKESANLGETVSYTIKYINNTGTHVEADCSSQEGWIALNGSSVAKVDGGHLLLNTEGSHLFAPEYSYGKDGDVYLQLDHCIDPLTNTYVILRYEGGTPGQSNFKGVAVKLIPHASLDNTFMCEVYDNGKLIAKEGTSQDPIIYPGEADTPEFKFTLQGDHLYMYINNSEDEWVDVIKDWKGITAAGPGYSGIYVNGKTNSAPHLLKFVTDLDYAFNVTISDLLPEEMGNVSNMQLVGTGVNEEGVYDASKHNITWPTVAKTMETAIAPNDFITATFDAEVVECNGKFISNYGVATVYGLDSLVVVKNIDCGSACEFESVSLTIPDCACDSMKVKVFAEKKGSYNYTLYMDDQVVKKNSTGSFDVKESGIYYAVVTSTNDDQCTMKSEPEVLDVVKKPEGEDFLIGAICVGSKAEDNANYATALATIKAFENQSVIVSWSDANGDPLSEMPNPDVLTAGTYEFTYSLNSGCCFSEPYKFTFTKADTAEIQLSNITICAGQSGSLSVDTVDGYSYLWSDGSTENELVTDQAGTYKVTVTTIDGCVSTAQASISVQENLVVDLGKDTTICEANLPYVLDASSNYTTYEWNDGSNNQTLEVNETGTYTVKVTQGTCEGDGSVTVTVSKVEAPVVDHSIAYMVADTNAAGLFDKPLTTQDATAISKNSADQYVWYDANKQLLTAEPIPNVAVGGGNATETYYVSTKNTDGCESPLIPVEVTISGAPTPVVTNVSYCLNDPLAAPLEATPSIGDDVNETWSIQWYDASGTKISTPTPEVNSVGETTYYVSQISSITGAESGKVPVKVTVYGVAKPDVSSNRLQYCEGEAYEKVVAFSQSNADAYLMSDATPSFVWSVDNVEVSDPSVTTQKESITYGVKETYTIDATNNHVCESELAEFVVKTTFVPSVTGDLTVNYVMKEGENGTFPALDDKNPNVAKAATGFNLVWYDENKQESATVPTPKKNSTWKEGEDQKITYYVAQSDGTCSSDTLPVLVTISDSPMPKTSPVEYCQNAIAQMLTALINEDAEPASNYELVWYDETAENELSEAPTPKTDVVGETTYYVAQRHQTTKALSAKSPLKVTIYALPELTNDVVPAQCGGSVILSNYMREKSGMTITQNFYKEDLVSSTSSPYTPTTEIVSESGIYYSDGYYTLSNGEKCMSEIVNVEVNIHDLSDLQVAGDETSCPNDTKELIAVAKSIQPGVVTYTWEDGTSTTDGKYTTPTLTGNYGKKYTFTVKASAGACVETLKATHEVTINKGALTGEMTMNGVSQKVYKTCGDENITIATTHEGTDYQWSTLDGTAVSGTTSIEVTPTQTTTYVLNLTNVCATSDTVTVEVHPLAVTADWSKLNTTICEGTSFSANLNITGYDASMTGSYIKWYKNDEEQTQYANKETLSVESGKVSDSGVYRYEVSNGICVIPESGTTDSGELTVVEKATYTKTENEVSCSAEEVEIAVKTDDSDAVVTWADDATADATRMVSPTENTTYKFTVTRQTVCVTEDELDVQVKAKPEVTIEDVNLCAGDKTILKAEATGDELIGYVWTNGAGEEFTTTNLTVNPDSTEYYTITVKSKSCGDTSATVKVTVVDLPELEVDSIALRSREVKVLSGGSSINFEYRIDNGSWQSDGMFENIAYALHTAYAKDELGCEGSLMFEVVAPPVVLPEFFTPQGDGVNDEWDLAKILDVYPDAVVKVFDRYGKVVAELKGDVDSWDGSYNGKMLPSTDYWYTINIPEIDRMYSGHFTLIRSK